MFNWIQYFYAKTACSFLNPDADYVHVTSGLFVSQTRKVMDFNRRAKKRKLKEMFDNYDQSVEINANAPTLPGEHVCIRSAMCLRSCTCC